MRFFNVAASILLASAGIAAAAECQAQNILDACLKTTEPGVKRCSANDWQCLCDEYTNVLTCYNNCPDHEDKFGAQQQVTANCNAAKSYKSSSSSSASSEPTEAPSMTKHKGSGGDGKKEEGTTTASGSAETATATETGAAVVGRGVEVGGVVVGLLVGLGGML